MAGLGSPRRTLVAALAALRTERLAPGHAVDIGCGVGRDTLPLLAAGWHVTAIDREPPALRRLGEAARSRDLPAPDLLAAPMETAPLPSARLVNASFALFLCPPAAFGNLWRRIHKVLQPGGRLACQLLGPTDSWAQRPGLTIHDRPRLTGLLGGYSVELLDREQTDVVTPRGSPKRWDVWHLVLRRG